MRYYVSILCLFCSGIGCFLLLDVARHGNPLLVPVLHLALIIMVLYMGRRHEAAGTLNTLAFLIAVAVSIAGPLIISSQRGPMRMLGAFGAFGVYAVVLLVMPLLCLLTHLEVKRRRRDNRRGFPVIMPDDPTGE